MARARAKKDTPALTKEQIIYLAGVFESGIGLKSVNEASAVAISKHGHWPEAMKEIYGGRVDSFHATKTGKLYYGWWLTNKEKYILVKILEQNGVTIGTEPGEFDGVKGKLLKAVPLDERDGLD